MVYRATERSRQKRAARRQMILDAGIRLFGEQGYHDTTVPAIVEAADSSIGAFYNHFRNKEDVFEAVLERIGGEIAEALNHAIGKWPDDVFSQMKGAIDALVTFLSTHPGHARILIVESAGLGERLTRARRRIIDSHTRSVAAALKTVSQQLGPLDPIIAASCWVGAVLEAVFQWCTTSPAERRSVESLSHDVALFNLRAVGAPVQRLF
jgi:AcrR family transcriptional regulator